jgi:hypothetical protein
MVDGSGPATPIFERGRGVLSGCCSGPRQTTAATRRDCEAGRSFCVSSPAHVRAIRSGGSPMTDVAYLCHNCGSVHEVESIRQNLILDLRTAASYELSGQHRILNPRARFLRWRMTRGLVHALWPGYSRHPRLARRRRLAAGPPAALTDRPVPCRVATGGRDARVGNPASASTGGRLAGISVESSTSAPWRGPRSDRATRVERRTSGGNA